MLTKKSTPGLFFRCRCPLVYSSFIKSRKFCVIFLMLPSSYQEFPPHTYLYCVPLSPTRLHPTASRQTLGLGAPPHPPSAYLISIGFCLHILESTTNTTKAHPSLGFSAQRATVCVRSDVGTWAGVFALSLLLWLERGQLVTV